MAPGVFVCPDARQGGGRGGRAKGRLAVGMAHAPEVVVILGLLVIVAVVAAVVRYVRIPYTVALVLTGLALALLPDIPRVQLTPSIILTIFLPVLLFYGAYNGAYNLALADLRANLAPIALLALPGVVATNRLNERHKRARGVAERRACPPDEIAMGNDSSQRGARRHDDRPDQCGGMERVVQPRPRVLGEA